MASCGADRGAGTRRALGWLVAVAATAPALLALLLAIAPASPPAQWLSQLPLIAHAVAFARVLGVLLLVAALVAIRARWLRIPAVLAAVAGAVFAIAPAGGPPGVASPAATGRELTVITYNTQGTLTDARLSGIVDRYAPEIVVLPETAAASHPGYTALTSGTRSPTTMLVDDRLALTEVAGPDVTWGSVAVRIDDGPVVAGLHAMAPLPGNMDAWRADLAEIDGWIAGGEPVVVAGDFNATRRHGPLADRDLHGAARCGGRGTWPAALPSWLTARIDHVLVSPGIAVHECGIGAGAGSDHRPLAVRVSY